MPLSRGTVPIAAPSLKNITLPDAPGAATVALKVIVLPTILGATVVTVVLVASAATIVSVTTLDTPAGLYASPLYTAVMASRPTGKLPTDKLATPAFTLALPSKVAPAKNVTVPVTVAAPVTLLTAALSKCGAFGPAPPITSVNCTAVFNAGGAKFTPLPSPSSAVSIGLAHWVTAMIRDAASYCVCVT